jgi:GxxExxY protein
MIYKKKALILLELFNNLRGGFLEEVYKDALEYEFKNNNISFEREKEAFGFDYFLIRKFLANFRQK